jgi:hypothetical protein
MRHIFFGILLLALIGCTTGMSSIKDVSSDSRVQHHIGRVFVLKEDVYLCTYEFISSEYPLLAMPIKEGIHGLADPLLPGPVSIRQIGFTKGKVKIVGVLTKGTSVRFERVMHYSAPSRQDFYIILSTSDVGNSKVEFRLPAIGGLSAASDRAFGIKPWFFDYYAEEVTWTK